MKSKDLQLRQLHPERLSIKTEGEVRSFPDKKKLKEFVNTKPVLHQRLKGFFEKKKKKRTKKKPQRK